MKINLSQKPKQEALTIEVSCVYADVINGDIILGRHRVGTIQFHIGKKSKQAIKLMKSMGVKFNATTISHKELSEACEG